MPQEVKPKEEKPLAINATQLRKRLGNISKSALAKIIAENKIRPLKVFARNRLFSMEDVEKLLNDRK